jgi:hypothetical protein
MELLNIILTTNGEKGSIITWPDFIDRSQRRPGSQAVTLEGLLDQVKVSQDNSRSPAKIKTKNGAELLHILLKSSK